LSDKEEHVYKAVQLEKEETMIFEMNLLEKKKM
jgi:hypothetical protein